MVEAVAQIVMIWTILLNPAPRDEFKTQLEINHWINQPPPPPIVIPEPPKAKEVKPAPRPRPAPVEGMNREILDCIAKHEGTYTSVSSSGKYRGRYQFDNQFWQSYGGSEEFVGRMQDAPPEMQDAVAWRGFQARGLSPWPTPERECAYLL